MWFCMKSIPKITGVISDRLQQMNDQLLHLSVVFECKKNGKVRIYVDYRELNKRTTKDAYQLPRSDKMQDS